MVAFNQMFDIFAEGSEDPDKMPKEGVVKFMRTVLEDPSYTVEHERVTDFIKSHDKDEDGLVERESFVKFYTDACMSKPAPVYSNIKACGFSDDFSKIEAGASYSLEKEDLAAWYINKNTNLSGYLFKLLDRSDMIANKTWELLNRLPPDTRIL